jgi:hypothetical protein
VKKVSVMFSSNEGSRLVDTSSTSLSVQHGVACAQLTDAPGQKVIEGIE